MRLILWHWSDLDLETGSGIDLRQPPQTKSRTLPRTEQEARTRGDFFLLCQQEYRSCMHLTNWLGYTQMPFIKEKIQGWLHNFWLLVPRCWLLPCFEIEPKLWVLTVCLPWLHHRMRGLEIEVLNGGCKMRSREVHGLYMALVWLVAVRGQVDRGLCPRKNWGPTANDHHLALATSIVNNSGGTAQREAFSVWQQPRYQMAVILQGVYLALLGHLVWHYELAPGRWD